jgi:hypothetical protein
MGTQITGEPIMRIHASYSLRAAKLLARLIPALVGALALTLSSAAFSQQTFKSPDDAVSALIAAAKSSDKKAVLTVFGADGEEIVSSGDPVNDVYQRTRFVEAYDAKHQIENDGDNKAILLIGDKDYPFPVPLVKKDGSWQFDTAAGLEEILFRRIGHDELDTIQTCLAYVDAQNDYAQLMHASIGKAVYAQRFISQPGKKDGLFWPTQPGENPSPLGELAAAAAAQGYKAGAGHTPYHGYFYKILTEQGSAAPGGAYDYVVRDRMIGGFALVAYPAAYRNSGVMTFQVNHDGTVYQKDLGPRTAQLAERMSEFNPDGTWKKVDATSPGQ